MKTSKLLAIFSTAVIAVSGFSASVSAEWKTEDGKKVYITDDGSRATGFETIDGKTFYFTKDGYLKTGWVKTSSGKKYYFSEKDGMKKGWLKMKNGKKYYMGSNGNMAVGWQEINGETYYFNTDGTMKTGFLTTKSGTKYYLGKDGVLARDVALKINGVTYDIGSDGKAVEKKVSTSQTSSSSKKTEFKDFPRAGTSKSDAIKETGLYNIVTTDSACVGSVLFCGEEVMLTMVFNKNDELSSAFLTFPMSYSAYLDLYLSISDSCNDWYYSEVKGYDTWTSKNMKNCISLKYDFEDDEVSYGVMYPEYFD